MQINSIVRVVDSDSPAHGLLGVVIFAADGAPIAVRLQKPVPAYKAGVIDGEAAAYVNKQLSRIRQFTTDQLQATALPHCTALSDGFKGCSCPICEDCKAEVAKVRSNKKKR